MENSSTNDLSKVNGELNKAELKLAQLTLAELKEFDNKKCEIEEDKFFDDMLKKFSIEYENEGKTIENTEYKVLLLLETAEKLLEKCINNNYKTKIADIRYRCFYKEKVKSGTDLNSQLQEIIAVTNKEFLSNKLSPEELKQMEQASLEKDDLEESSEEECQEDNMFFEEVD